MVPGTEKGRLVMKDVYVILAFHAHELLWDLPERMLSYLDEGNPMKGTLLDTNYLKIRKEEDRDIYSMCSEFGDFFDVPLCVEYTNELLVQIRDVMPESFQRLIKDYQRGRLYPIYGYAHHTHISLLRPEEIVQEIVWNREYLHNEMGVPYPKYNGLFSSEASYSYDKMEPIAQANMDYVIFPHLGNKKVPFEIRGEGDCVYRPFLIRAGNKKVIALPRNFPISQEIWRPITKMKRDEVKDQGYMLGDYPVFYNEYLTGEEERFPISFDEGVEIYRDVLQQELEKAPDQGVLVYIQDLELMDFGDIALDIMKSSWQRLLEDEQEYRIHFVTPDQYLEQVVIPEGVDNLPELIFDQICWAPEVRLVLRVDGHYPPLGVTGTDPYDIYKTGVYDHPLIFWENGKYYCGIFDTLLDNFAISTEVPLSMERLGETGYDIAGESLESQAVLYLRLMKRACNWGWRPTEGRQKLPCLKGYQLCSVLLRILKQRTPGLLSREMKKVNPRNFVGICEILNVFIDNRVKYLRYGFKELAGEQGVDTSAAEELFAKVEQWKRIALDKGKDLFLAHRKDPADYHSFLKLLQDYSLALYMATDSIQQVWGEGGNPEFLVAKMYHYLYDIYPPQFPAMIEKIDSMSERDVDEYFKQTVVMV